MSSGSMREETPEPVIPKPVYGFLKVVPRKSGGVQNDKVEKGFPIHGDMITFGR